MGRAKVLCATAVVVILVAALSSGCLSSDDGDGKIKPGKLVIEDEEIERGTANAVEVYLEQGSGSLQLTGGSTMKLMSATFRYNIDKWKPEISYTQSGTVWNLSVVQPNTDLQVATGARNEWEINIGPSVPVDLVVNLGAGDADIIVGSMDLVDLDVNLGAGNLELDISAYSGGNLTVAINCGAGDADLRVPEGLGVRIVPIVGVGTVSASGFTMAGTEYHSSDYDVDQPHIVVTAVLGVGDLNVIEV